MLRFAVRNLKLTLRVKAQTFIFEKSLQPMYAHELLHIQQQIACLVPMVNMMQSMTPINYYTNYFCDNRRQILK